jgi:putative transport-related membrane protein
MRKIRDYIYQSSADFTKSMLWELKYIFRDKPVFFSFIIVSILVSFLYTYLYSKETLEKLPIGVVDEDNTAGSRQLLRMVDATSQTQIIENYLNLTEAQKDFQRGKIYGIVTVPRGYMRELQRGNQPTISVYADASYMLYYKQIFTSIKISATYFNVGVDVKRTLSQGKIPVQALEETQPVVSKVVSLYNPSSGYATFLIPVVLVIIFQTTILTAVGILGGTMREGNKLKKIYPNSGNFIGALSIIMGKATAYLTLSVGILFIILGITMPLFGIPLRNSMIVIIVFMIPFILAVVFMGIFLLTFFRKREDAIMMIMYTSLPAVMLTGFSWPTSTIPEWIVYISYLFPSTLGAKGFVALSQMGANLSTISTFFIGIWAICIFYLILASFTMARIIRNK